MEKTSRLCNPEANHKKLMDYIIRKLILDIEKDLKIMWSKILKRVFLE